MIRDEKAYEQMNKTKPGETARKTAEGQPAYPPACPSAVA
jgi:hypothetical protein